MSINSGLAQNKELRAIARQKLKGNWLYAVLVSLVASLITGIAGAISLIIGGPLQLGLSKYFLKLRREENPSFEDLFDGFNTFGPALALYLIIFLFTFLWMLLFIIPGIIASFRYAMAFYIMSDNPGMKPLDALKLSKQMMQGRKGKLFMLCLSFIGWFLLSGLSCFIGLLWVGPYYNAAIASFYEDLKNAPMAAGVQTTTAV